MADADVVFVCEELCACRVCLATDVKLVVLYPGPLAETYEQLTGMQVLPADGLPQHLCTMCAALLKKSAAFRNKCCNTFAFLLLIRKQLQQFGKPSAKDEITMPLLRHLDRKYLKLPYITTSTLTINILGDITKGNESEEDFIPIEDCDKSPHSVKQETRTENGDITYEKYDETSVKQETQTELEDEESEEDCIPIEDCEELPHCINSDEDLGELSEEVEILTNSNIFETENPMSNADNVLKLTRKHVIARKYEEMNNDDKIKEYLITSEAETNNKTNKSKCAEEYDIVDSDAEKDTFIKTEDNSLDQSIMFENQNTDFFNYVNEKYVNKKETKREKRKMVDLTTLRVGPINYDERFLTKKEIDEFAKTYNFDIIRMTKDEQILDLEQRRKKCVSYQNATLKCEECFRGFQSKTVYKNHMAVHDPISGRYVCEVCKRRYWTSAKLANHRRAHKTKYVCRQCRQSSYSSSWAIKHYKSHSGVRYECQHCGTVFRKFASRMNHIRIHHGATECDICYERFQGANGVSLHKTKAHKQTYQCATCDVQFDNADAIIRHTGASSDGACDPSIRACAKCGELCSSDGQFERHVATHRSSKPKKYERRIWKVRCCYCSRFEHRDGENVVPNSDSCPCRDEVDCCTCPMSSVRSCRMFDPSNEGDAFIKRKWAHKGCCEERRLRKSQVMCEMCAGTFQSASQLRSHQRIHTGEKPFQCDECSKRFRTKALLQMHMPTHTGQRLYKCSLCPKAFKTSMGNHRHQLVHTKRRPHRCDVCDKTFQRSINLKTHVQTVHMNIPQPRRVRNRKRKIERTESE